MIIFAEAGIIVFTVTHMIGMTSTITNPILYAFLNENFTKEFK
jgi:neuropeptide Y receptor